VNPIDYEQDGFLYYADPNNQQALLTGITFYKSQGNDVEFQKFWSHQSYWNNLKFDMELTRAPRQGNAFNGCRKGTFIAAVYKNVIDPGNADKNDFNYKSTEAFLCAYPDVSDPIPMPMCATTTVEAKNRAGEVDLVCPEDYMFVRGWE